MVVHWILLVCVPRLFYMEQSGQITIVGLYCLVSTL